MENTKSRENMINSGFVAAAELPERHGEHLMLAKRRETRFGIVWRKMDYLYAAAKECTTKTNSATGDRRKAYVHNDNQVSIVYENNAQPDTPTEKRRKRRTDVVLQMRRENDLKQW